MYYVHLTFTHSYVLMYFHLCCLTCQTALLPVVTFYVHFVLVLVEFGLHLPADQRAIEASHRRDTAFHGLLEEEVQTATCAQTESKLRKLQAQKVS